MVVAVGKDGVEVVLRGCATEKAVADNGATEEAVVA